MDFLEQLMETSKLLDPEVYDLIQKSDSFEELAMKLKLLKIKRDDKQRN